MSREIVLAGDLGGTKTVLALVRRGEPEIGALEILAQARFESAHYESLEAMVEEFLGAHDVRPSQAAIGVAGPVREGRAALTNLHYAVDEVALRERLGLEQARLLNDLEATAFGAPFIPTASLHPLGPGTRHARGDFAVLAVGTGLGEALGVDLGASFTVVAGEGGHVDFAPSDERSAELLQHLWSTRGGHVSAESLLSGRGITTIFEFVVARGLATPALDLSGAPDPNVAVSDAGLSRTCPAAALALEIFAELLGAHAGDAALRTLPVGGVLLGGGIPPKLLTALDTEAFRRAYSAKGRFSDVAARIPVAVITERNAPLLGAARIALAETDPARRPRLAWP